MADDNLFSKVKNGDKSAFEKLFKTYFEGLRRYVWGFVNSEAVAEEIVQDIFLKMWEMRAELQIHHSLEAYLFKTAKHKSIDWLRHQEVVQKWEAEHKANQKNKDSPNQSDRLHDRQMLNRVEKAIQNLPNRRKEVFILSRYEDMTYKEIANMLDISVSTVETHMSLALDSLCKKFLPLLSLALFAFIF